jgi:MoxR-like ATPase
MTMAGRVAEMVAHVRREFEKVIVGQQEVIDEIVLVMLCGGHALVEGVPGLAKTLAVKTLAHLFRLRFQRVQCTPDLMPADIVGGNIFNQATGSFTLHPGPVFTDLLLVDEINRTPPRTQSALLEAMEERQVTIDGTSHILSPFFSVFATQNPIEFEGTYPLPEAQLDRFLMKIRIGYPASDQETQILQNYQHGFDARALDRAGLVSIGPEALTAAQDEARAVKIEPALFPYIAEVVRRTRDWPAVNFGASPRAAVNLLFVSKAVASVEGRDFLIPDDVKRAALPVLRHRLVLKPEADLEGVTPDNVIADVLAAVEVPK